MSRFEFKFRNFNGKKHMSVFSYENSQRCALFIIFPISLQFNIDLCEVLSLLMKYSVIFCVHISGPCSSAGPVKMDR